MHEGRGMGKLERGSTSRLCWRWKGSRGYLFLCTVVTLSSLYALFATSFIHQPSDSNKQFEKLKQLFRGGENVREALELVEKCLGDLQQAQSGEAEARQALEEEHVRGREREKQHDQESERSWAREAQLLSQFDQVLARQALPPTTTTPTNTTANTASTTSVEQAAGMAEMREAQWLEPAVQLLVRAWEHSPLLAFNLDPPTGIIADIIATGHLPAPPYLEDCELMAKENERMDTREADGSRPLWSVWAKGGISFELQRSASLPDGWLDNTEELLGTSIPTILGPYPPWVKGSDEDNFVLTRRVQRDIWVHQHPKDCNDPEMKFLWVDVLQKQYFGFGAQMSELTGALGTAIQRNWILVDDRWDRANHTHCQGKDHGRFSCYFRDLVSEECYLRAKQLSLDQSNFGHNIFLRDVDYWGDSAPRTWGEPWYLMPPTSEAEGNMVEETFMQESRWWRAQAYRYLLRFPTERTCRLMNGQRHQSFAAAAARAALEGRPPPSWLPASLKKAHDLHHTNTNTNTYKNNKQARRELFTKAAGGKHLEPQAEVEGVLQGEEDGSRLVMEENNRMVVDADPPRSRRKQEGEEEEEEGGMLGGEEKEEEEHHQAWTEVAGAKAERLKRALAGWPRKPLKAEEEGFSGGRGGGGGGGVLEGGLWRRQKPWIPRPLVSVHVRQGDKAIEMELVEFDKYMALASRLKKRFPHVRHIWLSTEMQAVVDATANYPEWEFFYTKVRRQEEGVHMHDYEDSLGNQVATDNAVVNLLMADDADFLVGALGSSWCYMLDSLRCTGGKLLQGYLSVNRDRHW